MIYQSTHEMILDDVFLDLSGFISGVDVLLKLEGFNPAGSIKMKAAVGLLEDAESRGVLRPGGHVIESSSGNLGIALSSVCAARGYRFTCVVDPNTSALSIALMKAFGAQVVSVDQRDANGGFLQSRIDYIHRRLAEDPALVWPNQYANPANPKAHYERTAAAIVKQGLDVDYLFVGAGTTGTLMGCVAYFREHSPHTRVIAVDTVGSVTFGNPPGRRYIPGLGTSRRPEIFDPEQIEHTVMVPEAEAVRMCRRLAAQRGIVAGGSTGSVLAAVESRRDEIPAGARVVAIAPDFGDRYLSTIYDDTWVQERFGADVTVPNQRGHSATTPNPIPGTGVPALKG
ncbi:2,3-diaminopropionate biosynthesis protein SbnA [Streptomyces rectiverticillatus]|uniref:2,3-diaminopropionate biosynthesis protein SbnA n=1 Tax=Streptomyces rectiverticillatus TaxID=173860 RepID=UPI0015C30246|nr:2,3-diaminopropionate biosynthesis protein SbnA [Streptomyces rectiverticillatus]QLE73194.1 2,3-diaminopropionate biosynthesis protein SbnA [Streptomyces rectiverticillatus]